MNSSLLDTMSKLAKYKDGVYMSMALDELSRNLLDSFVEKNLGLEERVDPSTYHITVLYSRTPIAEADLFDGLFTGRGAKVTGYEIFPTKTGGFCLVMRLDFPFAEFTNKKLTELGATSDYQEYKPHLTIAYNITQQVDINDLVIPEFKIYFDPIKVAPLDPQFTPSNK